jgi:hypothetical protein
MSITASVAKVRLACQYAGNLILVISLETKYTNHVPETGLKGNQRTFLHCSIRHTTITYGRPELVPPCRCLNVPVNRLAAIEDHQGTEGAGWGPAELRSRPVANRERHITEAGWPWGHGITTA